MSRRLSLLLAVIMFFAFGSVVAADRPVLPYYDWGACPFECCTYRQWTANADVTLYRAIGSKSVIASITKGTEVVGVTGVVITRKAGRIKVLQPVSLDAQKPVNASPGDILYTLHDLGEGYARFWFKGQLHDDQVAATEVEARATAGAPWQVLALPETAWWVKVRSKSGQVGWSKETQKFDHI